jgi:uncharacterized protein (DUF608 family)
MILGAGAASGSGAISHIPARYTRAMTTSDLSRRSFIASSGLAAAGMMALGFRPRGAVAGPFTDSEFDDFPIPADKKLDPEWVKSLSARGEPRVYSSARNELGFIGMPIGGICAGQLYLGGDGRLWHWDIFNLPPAREWHDSAGTLYAKPARPASPLEQGFVARIRVGDKDQLRRLDSTGFSEVTFRGEYPIGLVRYRDEACPVEVELEAFSPFCPLDPDESGTPATVMRFTVRNTGQVEASAWIAGWLQNAVCLGTGTEGRGSRTNRFRRGPGGAAGAMVLELTAAPAPAGEQAPRRPDIVFEDWERGTYEGWTATGTAFGDKPRNLADIAKYQGDLNAQGQWTVNTHETRHGEDVVKADTHLGTLTSRAFKLERDYVSFRIGGGNHPDKTCVNLLIDGKVVRTATGVNSNRMRLENWDVREFAGGEGRPAREAQFQIVDDFAGGWGQIGCDDIVLTDRPRTEPYVMEEAPDFGSMALAVLSDPTKGTCFGSVVIGAGKENPDYAEEVFKISALAQLSLPIPGKLVGSLQEGAVLQPGESKTITFVIAWHFPNPDRAALGFLRDIKTLKHHYGTRFKDATAVVDHIAANLDRLTAVTRLWRDTWYDSTLPYWLLDRLFATATTPATATCYRFDNGRFYGSEGTHCCPGTCCHVWQYGHTIARIFPQLERSAREMVDFGLEFDDKIGLIHYRGEAARELAVDGQCGTICRAYREHQMSADPEFLKKVWPRVKKATEFMLARDTDSDGILDGAQYNTLDTTWYGANAWLSSLYLAAVRAGGAMAEEMDDAEFAARCRAVAEAGKKNLVARLYNGEYFIHIPDPAHPEANNTNTGCHADQLLGQTWARQVHLGEIVPVPNAKSALKSIWTYCFTPDIGPYRKAVEDVIKGGRWYAMPGEGGLIVCTFPKGGAAQAAGKSNDLWAAMYFNECWTGFEHHVASHMMWEGMTLESLAITRMVHDRHHASKRNPYNEVECSSHYARAMSAYGTFISACGYEYHGPKGYLAFSPRLNPENFRAAFTGAEGWGTLEQKREAGVQTQRISVKWGKLRVKSLGFDHAPGVVPADVRVMVAGKQVPVMHAARDGRVRIELQDGATIGAGESLEVTLS